MEKDIPSTWELILLAAIPTISFFGWALRVMAPSLFV